MSHIIGKGRYAGETYPAPTRPTPLNALALFNSTPLPGVDQDVSYPPNQPLVNLVGVSFPTLDIMTGVAIFTSSFEMLGVGSTTVTFQILLDGNILASSMIETGDPGDPDAPDHYTVSLSAPLPTISGGPHVIGCSIGNTGPNTTVNIFPTSRPGTDHGTLTLIGI